MRVLAITNEFPLPRDRGGPMRILGLVRALSEHHSVHLLALGRSSTTEALRSELERTLGGPVEVFDRAPAGPPGAGRSGRWLRAVAEGVPPWVGAQHSAALERRALELAGRVDVVALLDDYAGVYAAPLAATAPVIADKHNVMGWSAAEGAAPDAAGARLRRELGVGLTRRFERRYLRRCAAVAVTSESESERLARLYGRPADAVVPSAVDLPPGALFRPEATAVGWLGSHEYAPNVEGLRRFAPAWEALGREGERLLVAGGGAPPALRALARHPGIELVGYVGELEAFLGDLGAAVVPLWHGAGVKLKTLTFMAAGIPVAGTRVAFEGIAAEDGRHCLLADEPEGLAAALRGLLADPEMAGRIGGEGRALVAERYTWPEVSAPFLASVGRAAGEHAR
jgi:glycosyltransferase involved in cell wall biosynthesis